MASSLLANWSEKEFNEFMNSKKPGLIEFGAPWCNACKLIDPIISDLAQNFRELSFAKVDVSQNPGLAARMGVMSLPNILIINGGKVKEQIIGSTSKLNLEKILKKIK